LKKLYLRALFYSSQKQIAACLRVLASNSHAASLRTLAGR
jgi:hypothetical protein